VKVVLGKKTELWTVKDSVVELLKTLYLAERPYQVFASEEYTWKKSAPDVMPDSHLGNKSDDFHPNNKNNQLQRQV